MLATRPKFCCITNKAFLRYLMASSGLANCAEAGAARVTRVAATATQAKIFIDFLVVFLIGRGDRRLIDKPPNCWSLAGLNKFHRNFRVHESTPGGQAAHSSEASQDYLLRKASWQDLQVSAVAVKAAFKVSRSPVLAAAASLAVSAISFSLVSLNLACSVQISGLALVLPPLSVPGMKPAQGSLDMSATIAALSAATAASNGALPETMAPMRPKCWLWINIALWRYLMASSGLANCAAAGAVRATSVAAAAIQVRAFMLFLVGFCRT